MLLIKTIRFLLPFLKEMILGNQSLKSALRTHFWRVLLIVLILGSVALNFLVIPRLLEISYDHVALKRKYSAVIKQCWPNSELGNLPVQPTAPVVVPAPAAPVQSDDAQYRRTQEWLRHLQQRENTRN